MTTCAEAFGSCFGSKAKNSPPNDSAGVPYALSAEAGTAEGEEKGALVGPIIDNEYFSSEEHKILMKTWDSIGSDKQTLGEEIFLHIFRLEPATKQLFPFGDLVGDELRRDSRFKLHASRFVSAVEQTIMNLNVLAIAHIPVLERLGEKHVHIIGYDKRYLQSFVAGMVNAVQNAVGTNVFTEEQKLAWNNLGLFVTNTMSEGYDRAWKKKHPVCAAVGDNDGSLKDADGMDDVGDRHGGDEEGALNGTNGVDKVGGRQGAYGGDDEGAVHDAYVMDGVVGNNGARGGGDDVRLHGGVGAAALGDDVLLHAGPLLRYEMDDDLCDDSDDVKDSINPLLQSSAPPSPK